MSLTSHASFPRTLPHHSCPHTSVLASPPSADDGAPIGQHPPPGKITPVGSTYLLGGFSTQCNLTEAHFLICYLEFTVPSTWLYSGCLANSSNFEEAPRNEQVQTFTWGCFLTHFWAPSCLSCFLAFYILQAPFPRNQTSASPFKFPTALEIPSTDQGAIQMLATHSLWQESVHVCFCRDTAGKARGGEPHPDSEVSGAPGRSRALAGLGCGSGRAVPLPPLANMQDSRWKQGRQNQVGLGNKGVCGQVWETDI